MHPVRLTALVTLIVIVGAASSSSLDFANEIEILGEYEGSPIMLYLATDKEEYALGDSVWMCFRLTNVGVDTVMLAIPCMPWCWYRIVDGLGSVVLDFPEIVLPIYSEITLNPTESWADTNMWRADPGVGGVTNPYTLFVAPHTLGDLQPPMVALGFEIQDSSSVIPGRADAPSCRPLSVVPNPVETAVAITYTLPHSVQVTLAVYDVLGRKIAVLADAAAGPGMHRVVWRPGGVAAGVYCLRLSQGEACLANGYIVVR